MAKATLTDSTLGYVCFSENISQKSLTEVRKAAGKAGIGEQIKDIRNRNAFIRAVQQLRDRGAIAEGSADGVLRHKLIDDENEVKFQFSKYFIESQGATYDSAAVIVFDKKKNRIECQNAQIKELAEKLFDDAHGQFRTSDLNAFVARVIRKQNTKKVPIRDGVYFLAATQKKLADQLKNFFTTLGFSFVVLPVNQSTGEGQSIIKAIVNDFKSAMLSLAEEIKQLETEDNGEKFTKKIAANRLLELQDQLTQYKELAQSLQLELGDMFKVIGDSAQIIQQANMPVDALIAAVQSGEEKLQPVVAKLLLKSELISPELYQELPQIEIPKNLAKIPVHIGPADGVDLVR